MNHTLKQLQGISSLYDNWAEQYDSDCRTIPAYAHLDEVYDSVLEKYAYEPEDLVVELGCGTGIHSSLLVKKCKNVLAIDISSNCIRLAGEKVEALGLQDRINFVKCDAMHLPIRSTVASSVISLGLLTCHTDGCNQILREISRILGHRGHFLVDVQNKYSLNAVYYLIDAITRGRLFKLGFSSMSDFRSYMAHGKISWIFRDERGHISMNIPFSTFSPKEIRAMLKDNNLIQNRCLGAHLLTLIFPLEFLERRLPRKTSSGILFLGRIERFLGNALARFSSVIIISGYEK
jgi:demethylmenaquinone methyltransferase/2-methoxy-6-polyprenyl-1,4-benzoquinol methylase